MDLLRQKAGLEERQKKQFKHADESEPEQQPERISAGGELPTINGHINLFHDVEQDMVAALTVAKKAESKAAERGVKLAPDEKELKRWYTRRHREESQADDGDEDRSRREAQRKYKHDPLTNIEQQLASRSQSSSSTSSKSHSRPRPRSSYPPTSSSSSADPSVQARLQRESSERERALALIQRKKKELEGNMTPSTVYGGDDEGYRDVYNRQEVEDAHRHRDRRRHWDRRRDW